MEIATGQARPWAGGLSLGDDLATQCGFNWLRRKRDSGDTEA
jgi:hypothetical protein